MTKKRLHIIINPASGADRPILNTLNGVFHPAGIDWDVFITKGSGDAHRLAKAAVKAKVDAVAVYGGDGTVTEVASGVAGSGIPLAILPGGTANAIAQALVIPLDLATAAALLVDESSMIREVDLGQVGDRYFLIALGIGVPGELAEAADRQSKDRLGMLAYALSSIRALANAEKAVYDMVLDGQHIQRESVMCVVANSSHIGAGLSLAPTIDMTDGLLDVLVFQSTGLNAAISSAASMVRQNEKAAPFEHWQAKEVSIATTPPQSIQADGEVLDPGKIDAKIIPCAVRFVVPRPYEASQKPPTWLIFH